MELRLGDARIGVDLIFFGEEGELYLARGRVVFDSSGVAPETGTRTNLCALLGYAEPA